MSGYAASARLRGGSPKLAAAGGSRSSAPWERDASAAATPFRFHDRDWIELVGRPFGERLAAGWAELRETWSQTTFFLFDPESWR